MLRRILRFRFLAALIYLDRAEVRTFVYLIEEKQVWSVKSYG